MERASPVPEAVAAGVAAPAKADAEGAATPAAAAFARGDYRALRAELERGGALDAQQRAAVTIDPVHIAVLAACALALLAITAHYLGAGR